MHNQRSDKSKKQNKLVSDVKLNDTHLTIHLLSRQLQWTILQLPVTRMRPKVTELMEVPLWVRVDRGTIQTAH